MSSSPDLVETMSKYQIQDGIIAAGLEVILSGKTTGSMKHMFVEHPDQPGVCVCYIKASVPYGKVELVDPRKIPPSDRGQITSRIKDYVNKQYSGYKVYIDPEHIKLSGSVKKNKCMPRDVLAGIMIMKGKGFISFHPSTSL